MFAHCRSRQSSKPRNLPQSDKSFGFRYGKQCAERLHRWADMPHYNQR